MTPEILEVIDTAVKIGLGAIISGIAAYLLAKTNQSDEANRLFSARKLDSIEKISEHIDEYINTFSSLLAVVDGAKMNYPSVAVLDMSNPEHQAQFNFIHGKDTLFCDARVHMNYAYSKLSLLGMKDAAKIIAELKSLDSDIRSMVIFEKKIPTEDVLESWRERARSARKRFYASLADHYKA